MINWLLVYAGFICCVFNWFSLHVQSWKFPIEVLTVNLKLYVMLTRYVPCKYQSADRIETCSVNLYNNMSI